MTKILLITPPCEGLYRGLRNIIPKYNPLGISYLAAYLEKNKISVKIYDSFAEDASMDDIRRVIQDTDAKIIGITSVTSTISEAIEIAKMAKEFKKTVIIGGVHFTVVSKKTLEKNNCFDYGIVGEGEITLYEFLSGKKEDGIDGLVYRRDGKIIINKRRELIDNISDIPHPARHLLNNNLYRASDKMFLSNKKFFNIITSRGCPYQCTFCASKTMWGIKVRFRTADDVISELDELKKMGMEQLEIIDDTFTLDYKRVELITKKIKSLNIEWGCNARVNTITPEILKMLKDSNCIFIEYGIESGNQEMLNAIKKGITLDQARKAIKLTKKFGIKMSCSFIIGNIGETKKTIEETIKFAKELNPNFVQFSMLTPYPGTEVYDIARKEGYLIKDFEEYKNPKFSDPVMKLPTMSSEEIKKYSSKAYRSFYLSPKYIIKAIKDSFVSFDNLKRNIKFFRAFLNINLK